MAKMDTINLKLSDKQLRDLARLVKKLDLDRSAVIRLAIARLAEEEAKRDPSRLWMP
jgi:antitoxin component of RelBE/YafQ-DinJ toxin-antitoxin module